MKHTPETPRDIREMMYGIDTILKDGRVAINLDNAATTPPFKAVVENILEKMKMYGSIGRGVGQKSVYSSEVYEEGRKQVKEFFGLDPNDKKYTVIYTNNTTDGMNKLASALVEHECEPFRVISTRMEHHANDLPWRERVGINCMLFADVDGNGRLKVNDIERFFCKYNNIKYVTVTAAANVTGYVNDVHRIAEIAHKYGAKIIVDGAQIVAHREFRILGRKPEQNIDFFVFSAHKMYSPFGGGAIVGLNDILAQHIPCFYGGGMVDAVRDCDVDFTSPPDLYEAGSPNYPGVVGMLKAMEVLKDVGFDYIAKHEQELFKRTVDGLKKHGIITLYGDNENYSDRVGIVVFNIGRISDFDVAKMLAKQGAIAVRHAKFCAHPYVNRLLGKVESGNTVNACTQDGMVRVSFGIYTSNEEIDDFIKVVDDIVGGKLVVDCIALTKSGVRKPNDRG